MSTRLTRPGFPNWSFSGGAQGGGQAVVLVGDGDQQAHPWLRLHWQGQLEDKLRNIYFCSRPIISTLLLRSLASSATTLWMGNLKTEMVRSIYIWEKPLGPVLGYWSAPPRIFVEEAHILKNASKLAKIPVHIVQVNKFPIMGECLKTAAAHSPNKDDSIFPFLSMRWNFFKRWNCIKVFPAPSPPRWSPAKLTLPPLSAQQLSKVARFCTFYPLNCHLAQN